MGDTPAVMGKTASLERQLVQVLERGPGLRLAMLFGSAAAGTGHAGSDVDVGIIPCDPGLPLGEELALQSSLERACGRRVDLVRLDHASTLLRWQVASKGRTLLARPATERVRFVAAAASDYGDFEPALRQAARLFRRRLARPSRLAQPAGHEVEA